MTRLPRRQLLWFALLNLPLSMLMSPTAAMLPAFYLEYTAVTAAGLATATLVARVFDGITDPLIGWLSDRSGRRKPWMLLGVGVILLGLWPLYQPGTEAGMGHLLGWYLLVTLGWTLVEIPHSAMGAELSSDYHERSRVVLWRQLLGFVGGLLFMATPMLVLGHHGFTPEAFRILAWVIGLALPLFLLLLWWGVAEPRTHTVRRPGVKDLYRVLLQLPLLRYFLLTQVLFGLATGAVASLFVIYANFYLGHGDAIAKIAMPMTLAMALGLPLWLWVLRRVEKHRAWTLSGIGIISCLLAISTLQPGPASLAPMIVLMALFGLFLGLSSLVLPSLLADLVDYDRWRTGEDRAAILFAFQALVTKLCQGVGGAIALAIPAALGFSGKAAVSGKAVWGLKLGFVAWPCLLLLPMMALAWRYPLGRHRQGILARRLARRDDNDTLKPTTAPASAP
ncbi:MFS transporter [Ferrimonas marina]|uniref:Na+/melibiose symporter n=1 Tax=Ferrimonas marina TaxID=299255 RepID=A0A1M5ZB15_9GAMM|nr:MFS transporter [Ferrimonas marina]SHI21407.1 Na+/melibiose symporter [Ferrimonas marina]